MSTPGLDQATAYMLQEAQRIVDMTAASPLPSTRLFTAEARVLPVSGECPMDFSGINITNVYRGLDNVLLTIIPRGGGEGGGHLKRQKAVLVVSHYDSPVCSTGVCVWWGP